MAAALTLGCVGSACSGENLRLLLSAEQIVRKKTTAELPFNLPDIGKGQQVRLSLDARVNYSYACANNPAMTATVNGRYIVGADLLNKPLEYHCKNGRDASWATLRGNAWRLFSWPDFDFERVKGFESPYAVAEVNPFEFVWDITAYARPGKNTAAFTHREITTEDHFLVLRNIQVEMGDPVESKGGTTPTPAPTGPLPTYVPQGRQRVAMVVQLSAGGAIRLKVGNRTLDFTTRASEPEGKWRETSPERWESLSQGQSRAAKWAGTGYTVTRNATVSDDHVHIADTFSNTSDKLVGVMYENGMALKDKPLEVRLGGRPRYTRYQDEAGGTNPTAVARWDDLTVGIVAEDDVYRAHVKPFATPDAMGLADHELGLDVGKSLTVEWSIYPVAQGDYWDFLNAVRRNWGANFTLPGLHVFVPWSNGQQSDDYYRGWVKSRGVCMVTPFDAMFDEGRRRWARRSRWQRSSASGQGNGSSNCTASPHRSRRYST